MGTRTSSHGSVQALDVVQTGASKPPWLATLFQIVKFFEMSYKTIVELHIRASDDIYLVTT